MHYTLKSRARRICLRGNEFNLLHSDVATLDESRSGGQHAVDADAGNLFATDFAHRIRRAACQRRRMSVHVVKLMNNVYFKTYRHDLVRTLSVYWLTELVRAPRSLG